MGAVIYTLFTVAHLALAVVAVRSWLRHRRVADLIVVLLALTLAYDNLILVLGGAFGHGSTLEALSWPRFALHAFLTPLGVIAANDLALDAGWEPDNPGTARIAARVAALALVAYGVLVDLVPLELVEETGLGLTRYGSAEGGPPIPAILTIVAMITIGWFLRSDTRWGGLFWGGIAVFIGSGVPPIDGMLVLGNLVEIVFVATLLATAARATLHLTAPDPLDAPASA